MIDNRNCIFYDTFTIDCPETITSTFFETSCGPYNWNGQTYTESGIYEYSEQNDNNYSMSFDGNDDYIDIPDIPMYGEQYTGEFSFSAYVYAGEETATDYFNILSTDDNSPGNLLQWGCEDDNLIFSLFIPITEEFF